MPKLIQSSRLVIAFGFLFLLFLYHLLFYKYFPTEQGKLGHDYAYFFPGLLNGFYWFRNNGLFDIPWFTPAFCGGVPFFPNPQNIYYSVPQLLSIYSNPLYGVYLSFLGFAALGFFCTFQLLRKVFLVSNSAAFFGATVYLFNGFFTSRMLIGHITYQVFALLPLLAWLLLAETKTGNGRLLEELRNIIISGMLIAYMFYAGAANFIVPALIGLVCIWSLLGIVHIADNRFWIRLSLSGLISLLLSAAKLYPGILFMSEFKRDYYSLPGFDGVWSAVVNIFKMLFLTSAKNVSDEVVNFPFILEQHDFDYGVTHVPLVLILVFVIYFIMTKTVSGINFGLSGKKISFILFFILLLAIPVALNTYYPGWSIFLKNLPYIENSTSLMRWVAIFIPVIAILSSLAVNQISHKTLRLVLVLFCIFNIVLFNLFADRSYYEDQQYDPGNVLSAWSADIPDITYNDNYPGSEQMAIYLQRNDLFVIGGSQLFCYEPVFGYGLEFFPRDGLHRGSIMDIDDGQFNLKNPACYIFPGQNFCRPGDHFRETESDKLKLFSSYKPFDFSRPLSQKLFSALSVLTLIAAIAALIITVFIRAAAKSGNRL
jgi:hypothetical protein